MPENDGTPATTPTETPTTGATDGQAGTPTAPSTAPADGKAPTWEGEFNPERAAQLVANLRAEVASLKAKPATKAGGPKDEMAERLAALETRAKEADHRATLATVSAATGVPAQLLVGDDEAAVKAHAAHLLDWAKAQAAAGEMPGRPKPRLVPGHSAGEAPAEVDLAAIAKQARARY